MGYPDAITYPILFTSGDIRVECIVRLSPSISRIVLSSNGPADLSATQIERARNSIDPGSRESECCSRFGIARYLLAAGNGNYRQNTRRLPDIHFWIFDDYIHRQRICASRVPGILRFNITPPMRDIYRRALARCSYKIKFRYVSLPFLLFAHPGLS